MTDVRSVVAVAEVAVTPPLVPVWLVDLAIVAVRRSAIAAAHAAALDPERPRGLAEVTRTR